MSNDEKRCEWSDYRCADVGRYSLPFDPDQKILCVSHAQEKGARLIGKPYNEDASRAVMDLTHDRTPRDGDRCECRGECRIRHPGRQCHATHGKEGVSLVYVDFMGLLCAECARWFK